MAYGVRMTVRRVLVTSLMDSVDVMSKSAVSVRQTMPVTSQHVEPMRRPALSVWRTPVAMSAWKHDSTSRSTSWPAQGSGLWHGLLPYEKRPPRQEVGDGPRPRRPQGLFLRVRVCIAMLWCPRRDSNPHARRQRLLRSRCLPIPPRGLGTPEVSPGAGTPTGIRTQDHVLIRHARGISSLL